MRVHVGPTLGAVACASALAATAGASGTSGPGISAAGCAPAWMPLAIQPSTRVHEIVVFDDGTGPAIYAAGSLGFIPSLPGSYVAKWDGTSWSSLGGGTAGIVSAFVEHDDGSGRALYAGGNFISAGGVPALRIARWNGTAWSAVGGGLGTVFSASVLALATYDDGTGTALYAGGRFTPSDGAPGNRIAKWDGVSWQPLGAGLNGDVLALSVYDRGSGPELIVGGTFTLSGGIANYNVAAWNGTSWSSIAPFPPPLGLNGAVTSFAVLDDGSVGAPHLLAGGGFGVGWLAAGVFGLNQLSTNGFVNSLGVTTAGSSFGAGLLVGGGFSTVGGVPASNLASLAGVTISEFAGGTNAIVDDIVVAPWGGVDAVLVSGLFTSAGGQPVAHVAPWSCTPPPYSSFCFGDGIDVSHTASCPCGNNGAPGNGCGHSFDVNGANLSATGSPSLDTVVLRSQFEPAASFTLFMQHSAPGDAVFHDGVLCASGSLVRLRGRVAVGGEAFFPNSNFAQDSTTTLSQRGGVTLGSASTRYYAAWYRNAATSFCPPASANVTNGVRVLW